jgi:hypothetical protein
MLIKNKSLHGGDMKKSTSALAILACIAITGCLGIGLSIRHYANIVEGDSGTQVRRGHVVVNGVEVPPCFSLVVAGGSAFAFIHRARGGSAEGYYPVALQSPPYHASGKDMTDDERRRGYYTGRDRRADTPYKWLFVLWSDGAAFVSPGSLAALVKDLSLKELPSQPAIDI